MLDRYIDSYSSLGEAVSICLDQVRTQVSTLVRNYVSLPSKGPNLEGFNLTTGLDLGRGEIGRRGGRGQGE